MSFATHANKVSLLVFILLIGCGRDFDSLETSEKVEQLTNAKLCRSAKVVLLNRSNLERNSTQDDLSYSITASSECIARFRSELFIVNRAKDCDSLKYACFVQLKNRTLSIYQKRSNNVVINIW